jgi:hypothetical protein
VRRGIARSMHAGQGGDELRTTYWGIIIIHVGQGGDELRTNYWGILILFQLGASLRRGCAVGSGYRARVARVLNGRARAIAIARATGLVHWRAWGSIC